MKELVHQLQSELLLEKSSDENFFILRVAISWDMFIYKARHELSQGD